MHHRGDVIAGRLVSVAGPARESAAFRYDGDGNLYEERRTAGVDRGERPRAPPDPLRYTLDLAAPLIEVLAAHEGSDAARYLYGPAGRISATGATGARTYHGDVRGSVRAVSDERGRATGHFGYDAWGIPDELEGDEEGRAPLASLFGYIGERQDPSSGLVFLRARWYAPELGRFLSRDAYAGTPLDPRTQHPYVYAQDNPASKVDRTGFSASSLFDGAQAYAYDGRAFYNDPAARPTVAQQPLGQRAAYAVAQVFADLDSPDPWTQAAALLKVSAVGVAVAIPVAVALPEAVVASAGSTLIAGGSAIVAGASWLFQKAQSVLPAAARAPVATAGRTITGPSSSTAVQGAQRAVVIGERTERVRAAAERLGAEYYPPGPKLPTRAENIRADLEWLYEKVQQGYKVFDIGPVGNVPTSPYYNAETALLDALNYYAKWVTVAP